MAGIVRSAGTVYVDIALGSTDQVRADAQALKVEVDQILNDGGNNINAQMGNGASAGAAYKSAFEQSSDGLLDRIDSELSESEGSASDHGDNAGAAFLGKFSEQVEDLKDAVDKPLADVEDDAGDSGSRSGSHWYSGFASAFSYMKDSAVKAFTDIEGGAGGSGGRSGNNWGGSFFNSASGWFKKIQEQETGILGLAGGLAPLGIAGGAGVLAGAGSVLSSVGAPIVGAAAGGGLLASMITGASTNLTTINTAGANIPAQQQALQQAAISATTAEMKKQQAAIAQLSPQLQNLVGTLGQTNLSYATLSSTQQSEVMKLTTTSKAYKDLTPQMQAVVQSLQAEGTAYNALNPMQQGFVTSLARLEDGFKNLQAGASPLYLTTFQNVVKAALAVMKDFQPILDSTAVSFDKLSQSIDKGVGGSAFKAFLDKINTSIQGGAITKLADGIGDIASALGILWTKDSGAGSLITHLDNIGTEFKNWAASQGSDGSFTKFLDYLKTNGDKLGGIIHDIALEFGKIGPSLASFGSTELNLVSDLFNLIMKLPPSAAGTVADVVSALLLFQKFQGFAALSAISGFFASTEGQASTFSKLAGGIMSVATATWGAVTATTAWISEMAVAIVTGDTDVILLKLMYAWDGLAAAAQWLWNVAVDAFPLVAIVAALVLLVAVIIKYHTQIINFVVQAWNDIYQWIQDAWHAIFNFAVQIWGDIEGFLKNWWYVILLAIFTGGLGLIVGLVIKYHNQIWAFIQQIWHDIENFFLSIYVSIGTDTDNAWNSLYKTVTSTASNIWHDTVNTLKNMATDIANVFIGIANTGFIIPIDWVITNIINNGIIRAINDITGVVGIKAIPGVSTIPQVSHFAEGGVVKGGIPGKDSVPALLMPEEVVLSKDQVSRLGGHASIAAMVGGAHPVISNGVIHAGWGWNPISDAEQAASDVGSAASSAWNDLKSVAAGALKATVGAVINPLINEVPGQGTIVGQVLKGSVQTIVNDVLSWLGAKDKAANSTASVNAPGDVTSWITQGMQAAGVSGSDWQSGLTIIAMGESGGNQSVVNTTDSNAQAGHPSAGLMQFIQSTFSTYAKPGYDTWMNPVDQVVADAWPGGYITQRYGGIDNVPGVKAVRAGGSYVGYDSGGLLMPGTTATYNGLSQPEAILTPEQWNTMASLAARGSQPPTVNVYLGNEQFTDFVSEVVTDDLTDLSNSLVGGRIV